MTTEPSQTSAEAIDIANFPLAPMGAMQPVCPTCGALVAWNATRSHQRWHDDMDEPTLLGREGTDGPIDDPADKIARLVRARDAARERYFDAIEELHLGLRDGCRRRERKRLLEVACQKRDDWVDRAGEAQRAKAAAYDEARGREEAVADGDQG